MPDPAFRLHGYRGELWASALPQGAGCLAFIPIPTFPRLSTELALPDLSFELSGRLESFVAARFIHVQSSHVSRIQPAEVSEPERPKGPVQTLLDRDVNVLVARHATVQQPVGLLGCCVHDSVDDKAVDLLVQHDGSPPHRMSKLD